MEGAATPPPANQNQNPNSNANQPDQDNDNGDNNAPTDLPNQTPNQPPNQSPNQLPNLPPNLPPNQHASYLPPNEPVPANTSGTPQPVPNWPQPLPWQPAPQIIQQQMVNWSNFKPELAGKPEEDAEATLVCTNDWMQTHHFKENAKVDRFCLTLLGEAQLWYETLNLNHIDWLELHNSFRQQYSKLGNTPKWYFHQWRSFYFDENADNIDSYVTRVNQYAAMLNYGEPQILELMKNTLPSRLHPLLFPIDNLRDTVTMVKWVLIKEKIDRQKTGQSSTTPFMRVSDSSLSYDKMGKKGVTFDVMETLERQHDGIDKLSSLVSKMNVKMDRKETPCKPRVYQNTPRGQGWGRQQNFQPHNKSFSWDRNQNRGNFNYNNRSNRPTYRDRPRDNYRCDNRRHTYWSNDRHNNYRPDNRSRGNYRQHSRNRQNYRGNDSRQRYGDRSESRDRSRHYSSDRARSRERS